MEKLNALKKQKIRAVILLEAVVALAVFASIATLLLGQNQVNINGVEIQVFASEKGLEVYHGTKKLLDLKEQ